MPKQGQFAKSSRIKQLNNFKVKRHGQGNTISTDQFTDYLLVRFALTSKKKIAKGSQETVQRFLIEVCDQLLKNNGDLSFIPSLLADINHRAPWQFYMKILPEWPRLQSFLQREVPAVPLAKRCYLKGQLSEGELTKSVAQLLATKAAAITFLKQPNAPTSLKEQTVELLLPSIYQHGQIEWSKVRTLLAPFPYQVSADLDKGTREWLLKLSQC